MERLQRRAAAGKEGSLSHHLNKQGGRPARRSYVCGAAVARLPLLSSPLPLLRRPCPLPSTGDTLPPPCDPRLAPHNGPRPCPCNGLPLSFLPLYLFFISPPQRPSLFPQHLSPALTPLPPFLWPCVLPLLLLFFFLSVSALCSELNKRNSPCNALRPCKDRE